MVIENDSRGKIKEKRKIKKRKDLTLQDMKRSPRGNRREQEIELESSPSIHDRDLSLSVSDKDYDMVGSKDNIGLINLPTMPVRRRVLKRYRGSPPSRDSSSSSSSFSYFPQNPIGLGMQIIPPLLGFRKGAQLSDSSALGDGELICKGGAHSTPFYVWTDPSNWWLWVVGVFVIILVVITGWWLYLKVIGGLRELGKVRDGVSNVRMDLEMRELMKSGINPRISQVALEDLNGDEIKDLKEKVYEDNVQRACVILALILIRVFLVICGLTPIAIKDDIICHPKELDEAVRKLPNSPEVRTLMEVWSQVYMLKEGSESLTVGLPCGKDE
jgi:hypothetical protein